SFCLSCYCVHHDLRSFPTRRSSDLESVTMPMTFFLRALPSAKISMVLPYDLLIFSPSVPGTLAPALTSRGWGSGKMSTPYTDGRSEEHTSELQSRENLVCRRLLEKK